VPLRSTCWKTQRHAPQPMPMARCRVTIPRSPDPVEMACIGAEDLPMELSPPRMFWCARCQTRVLICSGCDRGQIYCGSACSSTARARNHRDADRRYQKSRQGRFTHAARSRRYRLRQQAAQNVTDQGSPSKLPDGSLHAGLAVLPERHPRTPHPATTGGPYRCSFCGEPTSAWVRRGFLRRRPAPLIARPPLSTP
jgi:hypothetical protein